MITIIKKRLVMWLIGYVVLALAILCAFVGNAMSIKQLGIAYVALFITAICTTTFLFGGNRKQTGSVDNIGSPGRSKQTVTLRSIRSYQVALLMMPLILIYGLWDSNSFPLWVTVVGVLINIGITYVLALTVRSKKEELNR